MNLSHDDIEKYIERVCSGIKIVDVDNNPILFRFPDNLTLVTARGIYNREYAEAIEDGLLPIDEMKKILEERDLVKEEDRKRLASLKSKMEAQKVLLAKTFKVKANQDRIKDVIHKLGEEIRKIEYLEKSKLSMTAETKADESKILYLCWCSAYDLDKNELYWSEYNEFLDESDVLFRQKVLSEFMSFYGGIPTSKIRAVARSNLWRIRYLTSVKTSEPLFGAPTSEYTNDMLNLAYWSHYYQNVYEMMPENQPSDLIIEDDEALDAYLKDYYGEKSQDAARRKDTRKRRGKLQAFNDKEVIVTRSNELYQDVKYDIPREAQGIKDRNLIRKKKRVEKGTRVRTVPDKLPTK
jgi:hypothetical protein